MINTTDPGFPHIYDAAECNNLEIGSEGKLYIGDNNLEVNGDVTAGGQGIQASYTGGIVFTGDTDASAEMGSSNVSININKNSAGAKVDFSGDAEADDFIIANGKADFDADAQLSIHVDGDFGDSGLENCPDKVVFTGIADSDFTPGNNQFNDVEIDKNEKTVTLHGDLNAKNLEIISGETDGGNQQISASEAVDVSGGTLSNTTRLQMTGSTNGSLKTGGNIMQEVIVDKDGNAVVNLEDELQAAALKILEGRMNVSQTVETTGNLTVGQTNASNAQIEIEAGKGIIVNDSLILDESGILKIKADESETGKLIPKQKIVKRGNGKAQIQRKYVANEWHYISSPVTEATAATFSGKYLQYHTEPDNGWHDITDPTTPLNVRQGYSLGAKTTGYVMAEFEGTPNGGSPDIGFTCSGNTPNDDYGWNLVGNPYPCSLDCDEVSIPANFDATVYLWDPAINDYRYYLEGGASNTASQYIALAQGFMIHCHHTDGRTLTFTPEAMSTEPATFYKESGLQNECITYQLEDFPGSKGCIRFRDDASKNFDPRLDVYKLMPFTDETPAIYSLSGNHKYALNSLPEVPQSKSIALNLEYQNNAVLKLNFSGMESFSPSIPIILEDKKEGAFTDLRAQNIYEFSVNQYDETNRFTLHFKSTSGESELINPGLNVYAHGHQIVIRQERPDYQFAEVYSISGQLLKNSKLKQGANQIDLPSAACYILRLTGDEAVYTKKLVIR